jgi:hypothetical protein
MEMFILKKTIFVSSILVHLLTLLNNSIQLTSNAFIFEKTKLQVKTYLNFAKKSGIRNHDLIIFKVN